MKIRFISEMGGGLFLLSIDTDEEWEEIKKVCLAIARKLNEQ